MHEADTIPTYFGVRFTDGNRMWLTTDSPAEVLLHPVFLKYVAMCILLVSMLDRGGADVGLIQGQQIAFLWFVFGVAGLVYYGSVFFLIRFLAVRRIISSVFTPVIILPNLVIIHGVTYLVVGFLGHSDGYAASVELLVTDLLRDVVILLVFDIIFSNFVAYQHPSFSKAPVDLKLGRPNRPAADLPRQDGSTVLTGQSQPAWGRSGHVSGTGETALPQAGPAAFADIQIGGMTFNPADILALRSEDHYVNVYTATQKHLFRARLSEAVDKIDPRLGVMINRSTWVAFAGTASLATVDGTMRVVLPDGTEEPVAVMRRHAVRFAYETYHQSERGRAAENAPLETQVNQVTRASRRKKSDLS